jgi:hypothetical protein
MRLSRVGVVLALLGSGCTLTLEFDGLSETETTEASIECTTLESKGKADCYVAANLEPGSIGGGEIVIDWKQVPEREVTGGFVNGNELVFAVRVGVGEDQGALIGVDLDTGDRRLVAGVIQDADGTTREKGSGPFLGGIAAIAPVATGWMAHLWDGYTMQGHRVSIDPETGDRGGPVPVGGECPEVNLNPRSTSVLGSDGSVFVAYQALLPDEKGIARLTDESCDLIPVTGAAPDVIARVGDRIWFLDIDDSKLGALDPQTKNVEWVPGLEGYPLGLEALSVDGESAWAIGTKPSLFYDRVNVATGVTIRLELAAGPAGLQVRHAPHVWPHPDGERLILELDGAIVVLNPTTGKSAILSY